MKRYMKNLGMQFVVVLLITFISIGMWVGKSLAEVSGITINVKDAVGTKTYQVSIDGEKVTNLPPEVMPPVFDGPVIDGMELEVPKELGNQKLAVLGMVDVTAAPFFADPTGSKDSTEALQRAIDFARNAQMVCYLPEGTYKISDTLTLTNGLYMRSHFNNILPDPNVPIVLMGAGGGGDKKTKIILTQNSKGFGDRNTPRFVLNAPLPIITKNSSTQYTIDKTKNNNSSVFNTMIRNVEIVIGGGNVGAVGIHMSSAEGAALQDVVVDATNGYAGIYGAAGNGGSWTNVMIIGGEVGIDMTELTVPTPVMEGITLINQRKAAIVGGSRGSLTIVGMKIKSEYNTPRIIVQAKYDILDGTLNIIDSEIEFTNPDDSGNAVAIEKSAKNVYLNNVYVNKADAVVSGSLNANKSGWFHVKEYAMGIDQAKNEVQIKASYYTNGKMQGSVYQSVETNVSPPKYLRTKHTWDETFPGFDSKGAVNVKEAPYSAKGDGYTDDTEALQKAINENEIIFLPKGYYRVSKTLKLKPDTKLIGIAQHLSVIYVRDPEAASEPWPIVETADDKNAKTVIAFINIGVPREVKKSFTGEYMPVYALKWQSGAESVLRSAYTDLVRIYGFKGNPDYKEIKFKYPLVIITGNGGGKWYNYTNSLAWGPVAVDSNMRNLVIEGTHEPLYFYNFSPQHTNASATVEIRDSKYVTTFGSKTEGTTTFLNVKDSDYIRVFGHGGIGSGPKGRALYLFENTPNFIISNMTDQINYGAERAYFRDFMHLNYKDYYPLQEKLGDGSTITVNYDERPVFYKRGNPSEDAKWIVKQQQSAIPTSSTVLVNGVNTALEVYTINSSNYFKLRDLAKILSGTKKQFEVVWGGANNSISLTTGRAYTPVGGEMAVPGNRQNKTVESTTLKVFVDGNEVKLNAYNIGGFNYFMLRDVAAAINFGVTWDGVTSTIGIDTSTGYTLL